MPAADKDTLPPSYADSLRPTPSGSSSHTPSLLDRLTLVRARHIRDTVQIHILPQINQQAALGLSQTTLALLPSDIPLPAPQEKNEFSFDNATSDAQKVEVIGFSSDDAPTIVRLEGQLNRTEFWRPQVVINELERRLSEELNADVGLATAPVGEDDAEVRLRKPKRSFLDRVSGRGPQAPSPGGHPEVGLRQEEGFGRIVVKVRLEEISLRTVNEFGLYDTMSNQCVIVRVDARC